MGCSWGGGGKCSLGAVFPTEACSELVQKTDVIFLQNNAMNKVLKGGKNTHTWVCGIFFKKGFYFLCLHLFG